MLKNFGDGLRSEISKGKHQKNNIAGNVRKSQLKTAPKKLRNSGASQMGDYSNPT